MTRQNFAFDLEPGLYTLVVSAFGYEILETAILVPDADTLLSLDEGWRKI